MLIFVLKYLVHNDTDDARSLLTVRDNIYFCEGSLTIMHTIDINMRSSNPSIELQEMKTILLSGNKYPNIKRGFLRNRKILWTESNGNCCWKFYENRNFKGRFEIIESGFKGLPTRETRSISKISCNFIWNIINRFIYLYLLADNKKYFKRPSNRKSAVH